jgi:hypothetical protein
MALIEFDECGAIARRRHAGPPSLATHATSAVHRLRPDARAGEDGTARRRAAGRSCSRHGGRSTPLKLRMLARLARKYFQQ